MGVKAAVYTLLAGNGGKLAAELSGLSIAQGYIFALGSGVVALIGWRIVTWLRRPVLTPEQRRLRELASYFSAQANEAITELRDKQGNSVQTMDEACAYLKAAGRWFGRNEYIAGTVRGVCPNEVDEFLVHADRLSVTVTLPVMKAEHYVANHTKAHVEAKAMKLRVLSRALYRLTYKQPVRTGTN